MNPPHFSLALVTGASSGIGAELCRLLASKGISLIITGRNTRQLNALALELENVVRVELVTADVGIESERNILVAKIRERSPDLIINNAGFGLYGLALSHATRDLREIIEVNVNALLELTLEGAREMESSRKTGVILNISSASDLIVFPGLAVYAASKAFVTQFSRSLDEEMRLQGIRVLVSCPGVVSTGFRKRASGASNIEHDRSAMSVAFAAEEMWQQIVRGRQVRVFDWRTRLGVFFSRYILPQSIVSKILLRKIGSFKK